MRQILLLILFFLPSSALFARQQAPRGEYVQVGAAISPGYGLSVGMLSVQSIYTREIQIISDLKPLFIDRGDQARVAALAGVSLRLLGVERLVGYGGYRGFDVDIGLRTGPGLSFSTRDTRVDKNKRFVLLVEPYVRFSHALKNSSALVLEAGTASPYFRLAVWIPLN
ncbi:MAG: hypothetical protein HOB33_10095 [Bacteroidetes Order II. Incertae sedis bacterium]|nr:hypothetical protein [Bacteroidetes Order II. bacterium]MBT6201115.1 hypothetical protein [Bacteroidetes Order II. bacterium]MBT6599396.1 hypothetical protein [Bacteroidetes Order II. bacterium]